MYVNTQNDWIKYLIICILILICVVLFIRLEYYTNGQRFEIPLKNEYIIQSVYGSYFNKDPPLKVTNDYYTKTHWSLFDFLMISILIANNPDIIQGVGIGFGIGFQPINVKLYTTVTSYTKVYLNKEDSVKFAADDQNVEPRST